MKRWAVALAMMMLGTFGFAQQKTVISQYMYSGLLLNPAYAGNQNQLKVDFMYRKQWLNFDGAPTTLTVAAHSSLKNKRVGVGFAVANDKIGVHQDIGFYGMYAYKIPFQSGTLALGLQAGFNQLTADYDQLNLAQNGDIVFSTFDKKFNPNFGTGLFYSTKTFYAGLSVPYLLENSITSVNGTLSEGREHRYYFLTAGKVIDVNKNLKYIPSMLLRYQQGAPMGFDINMSFMFEEVVNLGISYRSSDAITGMFSLILNENLIFGYAYDHSITDISKYADGTHEFYVNYRISLFREKCHTYF